MIHTVIVPGVGGSEHAPLAIMATTTAHVMLPCAAKRLESTCTTRLDCTICSKPYHLYKATFKLWRIALAV